MNLVLHSMNFFAKYSVSKWDKFLPTRIICRKSFRSIAGMRSWAIRNFPHSMELPYLRSKLTGARVVNTYPYPEGFAPWPEDDGIILPGEPTEGRGYTLISDRFGFVANHSTSYVMHKIYETIRRVLRRPDADKYHAKLWGKLLEANGFREVDGYTIIHTEGYFVGVRAGDGEFGQVLWLEEVVKSQTKGGETTTYVCSTYRNRRFTLEYYDSQDSETIWYQIN